MTGRSLLLVDDEENILSALTRLLRREGYQIFRATSGMAGLELLEQHEGIGVIVSDQRMPELTGVEFLRKVKELYPDTVRIVLSGYTDLNSVTDAINQGEVYKFLTKPWDDALLRKNIDEAFQHYELKKENDRLTRELQDANVELNGINKDLQRRVGADSPINRQESVMAQDVVEGLPCGVLVIDDNGTLLLANPAARRLMDSKDREVIGMTVRDILPEPMINLLAHEGVEGGAAATVSINGAVLRVWRAPLGPGAGAGTRVWVVMDDPG